MALWDDMLDEFRVLGGTADNLCLKEGRFGRGLFPCDKSKPIEARVPDALLVDTRYISFEGDEFRLSPEAPVGPRERAFLEAYQRDFSWGVARFQTGELLRLLADAPPELRKLLDDPFGAGAWLRGPTTQAVRERYFGTRHIIYKGRDVLMPVVELANHGHLALCKRDDGISIAGTFEGEILTRYSSTDALDIFNNWGFASADEPLALSLRMTIESEAGDIVIERGAISYDPARRPFFPDVKIEGRRITLSYMMLGHRNFPRLAKGNFYRIMRDAGRGSIEETFDGIARANRAQFLNLMAVSEDAEPALGRLVRDMARHQLGAMSHAVGTREV
jgi:hypothetical protein